MSQPRRVATEIKQREHIQMCILLWLNTRLELLSKLPACQRSLLGTALNRIHSEPDGKDKPRFVVFRKLRNMLNSPGLTSCRIYWTLGGTPSVRKPFGSSMLFQIRRKKKRTSEQWRGRFVYHILGHTCRIFFAVFSRAAPFCRTRSQKNRRRRFRYFTIEY